MSDHQEDLPIDGVHEAALYVSDLVRAERFWVRLGLERIGSAPGRHVFFRAGTDLLLIFDSRGTISGGRVPGHGTVGPGHVALGVADIAALEECRAALEREGIEVEAETEWPTGGRSIYFRDPDGNSVEFITRGSWG